MMELGNKVQKWKENVDATTNDFTMVRSKK
jgi:hypothetical protein